TTRDGKEYLVPNEDLITQRVTNWSYSNDLIRLHVKMGISYQSDPDAAIRLALDAARNVPRVLADPPPNALLVNFGDSTIDLELRFWIRDPVMGTANVRSAVMLRIWDLYQANGIELPNPQRDITLRNPDSLAGLLRREARSGLRPEPHQVAPPLGTPRYYLATATTTCWPQALDPYTIYGCDTPTQSRPYATSVPTWLARSKRRKARS